MKKYIIVILCALLLLVVVGNHIVVSRSQDATLTEQRLEIEALTNEVGKLSAAIKNKQTELIFTITGLNMQRTVTDDKVVSDFLEIVCTWDSYDEYMTARETIMRRYDLSEDSEFMSIFMPVVGNKTSPDGTNYNQIDTNGLNMDFESVDSYVTKISADRYSYFTIVNIRSSWKNGGESIVRAAITYTIDADGELTNISAIPLNS
jgi:hypothetical protein